jgi:hypothetical protein
MNNKFYTDIYSVDENIVKYPALASIPSNNTNNCYTVTNRIKEEFITEENDVEFNGRPFIIYKNLNFNDNNKHQKHDNEYSFNKNSMNKYDFIWKIDFYISARKDPETETEDKTCINHFVFGISDDYDKNDRTFFNSDYYNNENKYINYNLKSTNCYNTKYIVTNINKITDEWININKTLYTVIPLSNVKNNDDFLNLFYTGFGLNSYMQYKDFYVKLHVYRMLPSAIDHILGVVVEDDKVYKIKAGNKVIIDPVTGINDVTINKETELPVKVDGFKYLSIKDGIMKWGGLSD